MSEIDAASTPFATELDLSSVVRRFSSWKNRHEPADNSPGLRELSYEEAARSSRFSHNALRRDLEIAVAAAPADREPETENEVPVQVADGMGVLPIAEAASTRKNPGLPGATSAGRRAGAARLPAAEVRALLRSAVASLAQTKPALARQKHSHTDTQPTFAAALMRASCSEVVATDPAKPLSLETTGVDCQTVPLTLPAADWELIRKRASEANLTIPAYVRQCALEVEKLRALVDHALTTLQTPAAAAHPAQELEEITSPPSPTTPMEANSNGGRALVEPAPEGMLTRIGSLFARRGPRISVTA
jgi:hypothetical protein